jgi:endonuclease G, mitochondrial
MAIERTTYLAARNALWSQEARRWLYDRNVVMIDFGPKEQDGELLYDQNAIRFHVREKYERGHELESAIDAGRTEQKLPKKVGAFETDVQQNAFVPHWSPWVPAPAVSKVVRRNGRVDPMQCGISISDEFRNTAGTLGGFVRDRQTGDLMLLSNWHVVAAGWHANPRHRIFQPGRLDGGIAADAIATFTRHGMFNRIDAAVATLTQPGRAYVNRYLDLRDFSTPGSTSPRLGMQVVKSGRTSGVTYGNVNTAVSGSMKVNYNGVSRIIEPVFIISPNHPGDNVSSPGDSGSIWLDTETMQAIGVHVAGSNNPEQAVAIEMPAVLRTLGVDLL